MKIVAGVATIPSRLKYLGLILERIRPQVDDLWVMIDKENATSIDPLVDMFNLNVVVPTRIDDARKFIPVKHYENAYYFSLDDDLLYPKDYVARMLKHMSYYDNKLISCVHGSWISKLPCQSYYQDKRAVHFQMGAPNGYQVMFPGTGTTAFHTSIFQPRVEKHLPYKNIADVQIGLAAHKQDLPVLTVPRKRSWVTQISYIDPTSNSIWARRRFNDELETNLINTHYEATGFKLPELPSLQSEKRHEQPQESDTFQDET